jgi:hypothetical protein
MVLQYGYWAPPNIPSKESLEQYAGQAAAIRDFADSEGLKTVRTGIGFAGNMIPGALSSRTDVSFKMHLPFPPYGKACIQMHT